MDPTVCPTPWKIKYDNRGNARHMARNTHGKGHRAYRCVCGAWHLSSMSAREAKLAKARA